MPQVMQCSRDLRLNRREEWLIHQQTLIGRTWITVILRIKHRANGALVQFSQVSFRNLAKHLALDAVTQIMIRKTGNIATSIDHLVAVRRVRTAATSEDHRRAV